MSAEFPSRKNMRTILAQWGTIQDSLAQITGFSFTTIGRDGKVLVDGVAEIHGEKVFVLKFLQGRDPQWVGRPFFAEFDPEATWLSDLKPALGEDNFFFEEVDELVEAPAEIEHHAEIYFLS